MSKTLYVRGIRNSTHKKITAEADKRGTTAASIVEDALEKWLKIKKMYQKNTLQCYILMNIHYRVL